MGSATVMVVLKSVHIVNNGAVPDFTKRPPVTANVAVMTTLELPNGTQASQLASSQVPLGNDVPLNLDLTDVYEKGNGPVRPLQFKILIEDQSPLTVELALAENPSLFGKILAGVLSAMGSSLSALVPGGSFATAAVNGLIGLLGGKLKDASGNHIQPIGTGSLRIVVSDLTTVPKDIAVGLTAPLDVSQTWSIPNPNLDERNNHPFVTQSGNVINKGQANGEVVFSIYKLA